MNIQMSELMMSGPFNFLHISIAKMTEINISAIRQCCLTSNHPTQMVNVTFMLTNFNTGICFELFVPKKQIQNVMYSLGQIVRHDVTNSLI